MTYMYSQLNSFRFSQLVLNTIILITILIDEREINLVMKAHLNIHEKSIMINSKN